MHGWKQAHPAECQVTDGAARVRHGVRRRGIEHEEADQPGRMPTDGDSYGVFVAGDAGDERGPTHLVRVQLTDPAIGERFRASWIVPLQFATEILDRVVTAALSRQGREKAAEEEVTVDIVRHPNRDTMIEVHLALLIYAVGAVVGLVLADAPPRARVALALLWPIGPAAFAVTLSVLLAASVTAFPLVGAIITAGLLAWLTLAR